MYTFIMRRVFVGVAVIVLVVAAMMLRRPSPSLRGLWTATPPARQLSDEVRFYYFHDGDKGLYRYGKAGYNNTASFDWHLAGDELTLTFRKTGAVARTKVAVEDNEGKRVLVLRDDPRLGGTRRYAHEPSALGDLGGPLSIALHDDGLEDKLAGRLWYDETKYATGGMGFRMYQLSEHALPAGRQLGWYHVGDFDDWSTETLDYRELPGGLELHFGLRDERANTQVTVEQARDRRLLRLASDPRDFGARARFLDVGKSF